MYGKNHHFAIWVLKFWVKKSSHVQKSYNTLESSPNGTNNFTRHMNGLFILLAMRSTNVLWVKVAVAV